MDSKSNEATAGHKQSRHPENPTQSELISFALRDPPFTARMQIKLSVSPYLYLFRELLPMYKLFSSILHSLEKLKATTTPMVYAFAALLQKRSKASYFLLVG